MTDGDGWAIEVAGLCKSYGSTAAVQDLSFTVAYGRITGLLGPNGAGKTTTLRALLGLIRPSAGTMTIDGLPYGELPDPVRKVGALLDDAAVHPGRRGRDHLRVLALAANIPARRVETLLSLVDLQSAADQKAGEYSFGMRRRLALATALLGDPQVLVLDEPANGLDAQGIRWLRELLRSLAGEGRAILVSSHVLAEVAQSVDDVVMIRDGRSVVQASLDHLLDERTAGTRVVGADIEPLTKVLRADGAQVEPDGAGAIVVRDRATDEILRAVAEHQLIVSEVSPVGATLEEIYLALTTSPNGGRS